MKKFLALFLIFMFCTCMLSACGNDPESDIVGTWEYKNEITGQVFVYEFYENGTFEMTVHTEWGYESGVENGTYTISKMKKEFKLERNTGKVGYLPYEYENGEFILNYGDYKRVD